MSGDVQPRKRKNKARKRDALDRKSEGDISFSRQSSFQDEDESSSHGVHITKMAGDDVHLHVHQEHDTGGHWCAKLLFFSLLAILLGLIGLILMENRGLADLDTPLSESRFSNYFDGWVDEHRVEHDDHDPVTASIEDHDEHDEPFEEEEDHSDGEETAIDDHEEDEGDDADDDGHDIDNDADDDDDEEVDEDEENATEEVTTEQTKEEEDDEDDVNDDGEGDDNDDDEDDEVNATKEQTAEEGVDGDDDEEAVDEDNNTQENTAEESQEIADNTEDNNDDDNEDDEDDAEDVENVTPIYSRSTTQHTSAPDSRANNEDNDNDDDPFDEEEDDGTFESLETVVVDNDAEELLLLQEKARQQAARSLPEGKNGAQDDDGDDADADDQGPEVKRSSWVASLAVKIGVGVALALVARFVLITKSPNTNDEPSAEAMMKRRLTIASPLDKFPTDDDLPILPGDNDEDDVMYSEEEIEIEEEIEYVEEEEVEELEEDVISDGDDIATYGNYVPETFEQLSALYRPKTHDVQTQQMRERSPDADARASERESIRKSPAVFNPPPPPPLVEAKIENKSQEINTKSTTDPSKASNDNDRSRDRVDFGDVTADAEGGRIHYYDEDEDDDNVGQNDDDGDDDADLEIDDDDEDDISDVDDSELMNRLEAKYGRLPSKEYDSDDDDPVEKTWTQIEPKDTREGGAQAHDENAHDDDDGGFDAFEQELRRVNEEMMRENYASALNAFTALTRKYPDKPQVFLGKARALDRLADQRQSNKFLTEATDAYKRYLAFGEAIRDDVEYRAAAERCIDRMTFLGILHQAVTVHELLMERFKDDPKPRNQLAVTYLSMNRLSDAKKLLRETLDRWPEDGFAQAHYGFVLKQQDQDYERAVRYLKNGIDSRAEGTQVGILFYQLGDALQRLGRHDDAYSVYERGTAIGLFPSIYQRSLYNEPHLRAKPWWTKEETTYEMNLNKLQSIWTLIRDEALGLLSTDGFFTDEVENLRDSGDWKQYELYARGHRIPANCRRAPITCGAIEEFRAASGCQRGQVKFSVIHPGTHVFPHCGPTNCRLRAHLGLVVPEGARMRVATEERSWTEGEFLIFDDSFEHEVWHNGTSYRLVLIVDVWHPDLSAEQLQSLTPI